MPRVVSWQKVLILSKLAQRGRFLKKLKKKHKNGWKIQDKPFPRAMGRDRLRIEEPVQNGLRGGEKTEK